MRHKRGGLIFCFANQAYPYPVEVGLVSRPSAKVVVRRGARRIHSEPVRG